MSASRSVVSPWNICKRIKTAPFRVNSIVQRAAFTASAQSSEKTHNGQEFYHDAFVEDITRLAKDRNIPIPRGLRDRLPDEPDPRLPKNLLALYAAPMKREPTHGIVVCDLQLRSYTARSVELMADFALRAAYYLNLPAKGPVPLPRITNRWTVPKDAFIFKKVQENFERVTLRRLIQIQDGHPDVVQVWLSFIRKHCFYGVGMKANVYENEELGVAGRMDSDQSAIESGLETADWDLFETTEKDAGDRSRFAKTLSRHGIHAGPRVPTNRKPSKAAAPSSTATQEGSKQSNNLKNSSKEKETVKA